MSAYWLSEHTREVCGEGWRDGVAINWAEMKTQPWKPTNRGSSDKLRIVK